MRKPLKIPVVTGPTASGKTRLAVELARKFEGEIVSADSRQVYKGMDLGTGKDLSEYGEVGHHLIDIVPPSDSYNLSRFRADAISAISDISSRGRLPIVCGGSTLYIDCLLSKYELPGADSDAEERQRLKSLDCAELLKILGEELPPDEARNKNRIVRRIERKRKGDGTADEFPFDPEWLVIGVLRDRKEIHQRIEKRLKARLSDGMIDEVRRLHDGGLGWEKLEYFGLEYKYIAMFLQGKISGTEMSDTLLARIRNFARRQDIWFRKMERSGHRIHWIGDGNAETATNLVGRFISGEKIPAPDIRLSEIFY